MKFFDSPTMRETIHRLLRSQMALKGVDYNSLSQRLAMLGVAQTATNLRSKVNHGTLGAQLFIYIQFALGIDDLELDGIKAIYQDVENDLKLQAADDISRSAATVEEQLLTTNPPQNS
ncbi:MAG: hypothetical protein F4W90_01875 [Gammaproteobacteria bacterium]|nr:hypothetical protein [Gammaproteobacteria bacterium]